MLILLMRQCKRKDINVYNEINSAEEPSQLNVVL